eukprot:555512-Prymnesium_polylepis.1
MRERKRKRREECRSAADCETDTGGEGEISGHTDGGQKCKWRRKRRGGGEGHDLGGNCEWEGPGSDDGGDGVGGYAYGDHVFGLRCTVTLTAERGRGDHIFASARAHVA